MKKIYALTVVFTLFSLAFTLTACAAECAASAVSNKVLISAQEAQEAAIKRVPGATLKDVSFCELDKDKGIYTIGIYYRTKTYEASVNAETGDVLSFDRPS